MYNIPYEEPLFLVLLSDAGSYIQQLSACTALTVPATVQHVLSVDVREKDYGVTLVLFSAA